MVCFSIVMLVFGGVEPCALAFGALISWKTSDRRDMYLAAFASSNGEPKVWWSATIDYRRAYILQKGSIKKEENNKCMLPANTQIISYFVKQQPLNIASYMCNNTSYVATSASLPAKTTHSTGTWIFPFAAPIHHLQLLAKRSGIASNSAFNLTTSQRPCHFKKKQAVNEIFPTFHTQKNIIISNTPPKKNKVYPGE